MILINELKGLIASKGLSQNKLANKLGISSKTFYAKMKNGEFGSDEIYKMIKILDIQDPIKIFFADTVTFKDTDQKGA